MGRAASRIAQLGVWAMAAWVAGCAGAGDRATPGARTDPAPTAEVDPKRAYLTLDQLKPAVSLPKPASDAKPLSTRGAQQITRAHALMAEQRYTEAALELERALRYDPNHPDVHRALAELHLEAGNLERAATHVDQAVAADPNDALVQYIRGRLELQSGRIDEATLAFRTALRCSDFGAAPDIAALTHAYLAEALAAGGYVTAALQEYDAFMAASARLSTEQASGERRLLIDGLRRSAAVARVDLLEKLGRFGEAADALAGLLSDPTAEPDWPIRHVRLLIRADRLQEAQAAASRLEGSPEQIIPVLTTLYDRLGQPSGLADALRQRASQSPGEVGWTTALADALEQQGKTVEAVAALRAALQAAPTAGSLWDRLISLHLERRGWADALAAAADAVRALPEDAHQWSDLLAESARDAEAAAAWRSTTPAEGDDATAFLLGVVALEEGALERAEQLLSRAGSGEQALLPARVALGRLYLRTWRWDDALKIAARPDPEAPQSVALERIAGEAYRGLDDFEKAELHLKAAVQLDRNDVQARFVLAQIYRQTNSLGRARQQLQALLEVDPAHDAARELLIETYLTENERDEAVQQIREQKQHSKSPLGRARAAALLEYRPGEEETFREKLRAAMEEHGQDVQTWIAIGDTYNDFEAEQRHETYEKAFAIAPDNPDVALRLVDAKRGLLDFEGAAASLEPWVQRYPNRHIWRGLLVNLYHIVQDYDAALRIARQQLEREDLSPEVREAYRQVMVEVLSDAERGEEAVAHLREWSAGEPANGPWTRMLAQLLEEMDRHTDAAELYERALAASPASSDLLADLLSSLLAGGRELRAQQLALDRVNSDPQNVELQRLLAQVLAQSERHEDALELIDSALLLSSEAWVLQLQAAGVLADMGRHDEAIKRCERVLDELARAGRGAGLEVEMARVRYAGELVFARKYDEAVRVISLWLDETSTRNRTDLLRLLSLAQREQGYPDLAAETLEEALEMMPDSIGLNNDVAYGWIDRGVRLQEAEPMIRYAVARSPLEAAYLDTYGWLLYKKGDFAGAKKWLLRAVRAGADDDPVVHDHAGDACWRLGEQEQAQAHWQRALENARKRLAEPVDGLPNPDDQRVEQAAQQKLDAVRSGGQPAIAELATSADDKDE